MDGPGISKKSLFFLIAYKDWSAFWSLRKQSDQNTPQKIDKIGEMAKNGQISRPKLGLSRISSE